MPTDEPTSPLTSAMRHIELLASAFDGRVNPDGVTLTLQGRGRTSRRAIAVAILGAVGFFVGSGGIRWLAGEPVTPALIGVAVWWVGAMAYAAWRADEPAPTEITVGGHALTLDGERIGWTSVAALSSAWRIRMGQACVLTLRDGSERVVSFAGHDVAEQGSLLAALTALWQQAGSDPEAEAQLRKEAAEIRGRPGRIRGERASP